MRIESVKRDVSSGGVMQTSRATIKATPKIFDMFANDTYANKPLAIMRELVANGVDAHKAAGRPDRPVEVQLPTPFDPTCRIRDFGTGMHHDFVMGPFMAYTDGSTKDGNDEAIGGFGIGSKSPFAYVDQYNLRSVYDGVVSVYTLFKDEDGIPAIGLLGQTKTDEPNGVEVSFPVEDADMETFAVAAQEALQYFMPLPIVVNGTLNPPDYSYVGNGWAMRSKGGELGVIMGGVRYPVSASSLEYSLRHDNRLSPLLTYGLDLTLPIGACGVAMSREQLSYIPKTSAGIRAALEAVIDDVIATFATFFDNCRSEWDAMKLLAEETGLDSYNRSGRAQLLLGNARFRGEKLETSFRSKRDDIKGWLVESLSNRRRTASVPRPSWTSLADLYSITPGRIECVIIDDLPQSPKSKTTMRLREFIETQPQAKSILVVRGEDETPATIRDLLAELRQPTTVVYTSSMPEPAKVTRTRSVRPRVRMFTFNGRQDRYTHAQINNLTPSVSKSEAVSEIPYADQPASGIMVVMTSFDLPSNFHARMASGLFEYKELVFVNQADAPKLKDTFKNFDDAFDERLKKALSSYPEVPQRLAVSRSVELSKLFGYWRELRGYCVLNPAQRSRPFGRVAELYDTYVAPLTNAQQRLAPFVTAALPPRVDPASMRDAVHNKQPEALILMEHLDVSDHQHVAIISKHL